MALRISHSLLFSLSLVATACSGAAGDDPLDGENAAFPSGKSDGLTPDSAEAAAVLALVNDRDTDFPTLDDDAHLNKTAAENIIAHRDGPDGTPGTDDDDLFDDLDELDAVKFVGPKALEALLKYAIDHGFLPEPKSGDRSADVIFSPQPIETSHTARVAKLIDSAQHSIDIAMYSFSNGDISDALKAAVERGVEVRFVFETAHADDKLDGTARENSKSGHLEQVGVDVRYINKIMHHKFMIVDGPKDDGDVAPTTEIVSGSANWSFGGATVFDENTMFLDGYPEVALRMQQQFNLLWNHSHEFSLPGQEFSAPAETLDITDALIDVADTDDVDILFTSDNFDVSGDTFKKTGRNHVADQLVESIQGATDSIWIASGHLRLRSVAEALIAKHEENPELDIRVYLDAQEYISKTTNDFQVSDLQDCLDAASTDAQTRNCMDKGFLFGFQVGESGIDVRYKWYAQRWHFSYAVQMHNKFMIVDGDELWTGSFNLSDNALHNTVENMFHFSGDSSADLVAQYVDDFDKIWNTGRDEDLLGTLRDEIENNDTFPIVFDPMALDHEEVRSLKSLIVDRCPQVNSSDFRKHPETHHTCTVN